MLMMEHEMATVFWVSPDIDSWRLQREGAFRPEQVCATREEAIDWACRLGVENAPCVVKVQDYSGNLTAQFDFSRRGRPAAA